MTLSRGASLHYNHYYPKTEYPTHANPLPKILTFPNNLDSSTARITTPQQELTDQQITELLTPYTTFYLAQYQPWDPHPSLFFGLFLEYKK